MKSILAILFLLGGIAFGQTPMGFTRPDSLKYGLVGWWTFNGNLSDGSGYGYTGSLVGAPTYVNGVIGKGLSVSSGNYMSIASPFGLESTLLGMTWTATFWYNGNYTEYAGVLTFDNQGVVMTKNNNFGALSSGNVIACGNAFVPNQRIFVAVVVTNSVGTIYYNGTNATGSFVADTGYGQVGNYYIGNGYAATTGIIDDPRVYKRALSAAELTQLYNGGYGNP
jgi:hypothetical protein